MNQEWEYTGTGTLYQPLQISLKHMKSEFVY